MNPLGINTFDAKYARATFTLTNAAPQYETSNNGPWQLFEGRIAKYVENMCGTAARGGTLYPLTGTSSVGLRTAPNDGPVQDNAPWPDPAALPKPPANNNVAIPRSIWTAGCCVWQEGNVWDSCPRGDSLPSDKNIQRWPPNCTQWRAGSR